MTCFVDLTEEGEGPPLHPYAELLRSVAAKRSANVSHVRLAIRDVSVPTPWKMRAILATIGLAIDDGEVVYVHCWGGVGRTGTVLGCLLRETGATGEAALEQLKGMRSGTQRARRTSPETHEQRTFVEQWTIPDTLFLDQEAIDRLGPTPVAEPPVPIPHAEAIAVTLGGGDPVVLEGPGPGWCVQAIADLEEGVVLG